MNIIKLEAKFNVSDSTIVDILDTAFEGGINYWCSGVDIEGEPRSTRVSEHLALGGNLRLEDAEEDVTYVLTKGCMLEGIKAHIAFYGPVIVDGGEVDPAEVDADAADLIVQWATFGGIVFS